MIKLNKQLLQEKRDINNVVIKLNKQPLQQYQHCRDEKIRKQRFPLFGFFVRTKCVIADMCIGCCYNNACPYLLNISGEKGVLNKEIIANEYLKEAVIYVLAEFVR